MNRFLKATDFEWDHPVFVHSMVVIAAFLTYLLDRDDVVWRFIKDHGAQARPWEHGLFLIATIFIGIGAYLCTIARRDQRRRSFNPQNRHYLGQFAFAVGLASLLPLAGYVMLIAGEGFRLLRIFTWTKVGSAGQSRAANGSAWSSEARTEAMEANVRWFPAIQREALKWCVLISMVVFTITLRDRYADWLICASIVIAVLANWRQARASFL